MIQGRVIDGESGTPLSDVVVSNGRDCVRTGEDGRFELPMPAQPETNNGVPLQVFAFVSTPAGYRSEEPGGWYRAAEDGDDFEFRLLTDGARAGDTFSFAQITDLHVGRYPGDWIADDIRTICEAHGADSGNARIDCIAATGDLTQNGLPEEYDEYLAACGASSVPLIHVPGNHDWKQDKSGAIWTRYLGPLHFSLNWGPVHLVAYDSGHRYSTYTLPLDEWLAADLALVPEGRPVVMLIHHQFAEDFYGPIRAMTDPPPNIVMSISGHWHTSRVYDDGHTLHFNQPTTSVGGIDYNPRGYTVARIAGDGAVEVKRHLLGVERRSVRIGLSAIEDAPPTDSDAGAPPVCLTEPWPQYGGGSDRRGYVSEGPAPPYRRVWQSRMPGGLFFGSPVIGGERVFIPTITEENARGGSIACVGAATGGDAWTGE